MDERPEKYLKLNPFVQDSVGENVIWASAENDFCDVESINETAFKLLLQDIESASNDSKTRARFVVGSAGSGKSHLFARLRRRLPNGQFTFVSNPPTAVSHIKRFILKKIVSGMNKPVMGTHGPLAYTQLERTVYCLLQKLLKPKGLSPQKIHEFWKTVSSAKYPNIQSAFVKTLAGLPPLGIPTHVGRVLFQILDDEKRNLAASWLSGSQHLSNTDLACLGIPGPLPDEEISEMMKQLGHLSLGTGPIVLILDQLDLLVQPDQIREVESLMIDLNDSSRNWYVLVSLVQEKFDLWYSTLSDPFKERFGMVTNGSVHLATAELSGLSEDQKRQLILARLATPDLVSQRKRDQIDDPCYPLSMSAVQELACSDISNARMLIHKALNAYKGAVSGEVGAQKTVLSEFIAQLFADLRAELQEENLPVDTAYVADRVEELFRILWSVKTNSVLKGTDGSLQDLANFEGVDKIYTCGEKSVRIVLYDVQQTNKFPTVLKRIVDSGPNTILLRDGRISISGKATKEKLNLFQKDKKFFHLSLNQIRSLHALGNLLARMREGDFENQETDPPANEREIYECLAQNSELLDTDLAQTFLAMAGLERQSQWTVVEPPEPPPVPLEPDDLVAQGITGIMQTERWMSFERLCVRAGSKGITSDPHRVYECLKARPICESVLIYPKSVNLLESMGIVIWNLEEQ